MRNQINSLYFNVIFFFITFFTVDLSAQMVIVSGAGHASVNGVYTCQNSGACSSGGIFEQTNILPVSDINTGEIIWAIAEFLAFVPQTFEDKIKYCNDSNDFSQTPTNGWYTCYTGVDPVPTVQFFPLPVELVKFEGKIRKYQTSLHWQTASETNNALFQIQHSLNGKDFQTIGEVEGMGTTNEETNYEFLHENPANGINYYRLKQVDFDGSFSYSEVISIQMDSDENRQSLVFFPNPVQKELNLVNHSDEPLEVTILNSSGQEIFDVKMEESTEMIHSVDNLSPGIYWIRTVQNEAVMMAKFMKSK